MKGKTNAFFKKILLEFGEEFFQTNASILYCKLCKIKVLCKKKYNVLQYVWGVKHMQADKKTQK